MGQADEPAIVHLVDESLRLAAFLQQAGETRAARTGLTVARWRLLARLRDDGPGTVAGLARRTGLTRQSARESVARLLRDGLVTRRPNLADARADLFDVTPRGRGQLQTLDQERRDWARETSARLGDVDLSELTARMRAVREALE